MAKLCSNYDYPFISVIMPIRNEESYIEKAIGSVIDNDYPRNKLEVIVVDGMSNDSTRDIVRRISEGDQRVRLIDNLKKTVPYAMNIGLRAMRGKLFTRLDGHAEMAPDFLKNSVDCLEKHENAWLVGGHIEHVASGYVGNAIAAAMQSPVGVGNAMFRLGDYEGWVDTLAFGTHHKWILDKIGHFDEQLVRNQDDEFNMRVILAGGKIWISKSIKSKYYSRPSITKLWRQYHQYGFWRIRTIQKHKRPATFRQMIPMLFVSSVLALAVLGFVWRGFWWLLLVELGLYVFALLAGSLDVARKSGWSSAALAPLIFCILHLGYGIGCLWGFVRFVLLRGLGLRKPADMEMSR